jgi:hypothetical protein
MSLKRGYIKQGFRYHSLSIKDLLEAREAYHVFLTRKSNVIGTAIGKYRYYQNKKKSDVPKTMENSIIDNRSYPCILVFVDKWINKAAFGKNKHATYDDYIPQRLYLSDGREIPVCVLLAEWLSRGKETIAQMRYPAGVIGGGYPICTKVQGEEKWATLGCLVTDGRYTYGLTNAHVAGRPDEKLHTIRNGNEIEIGRTSQKQAEKKIFSEVYADLPGKSSYINLDIGLIELNEVHDLTSQVFGLGKIKGMADVNHDTLSLNLIGCPLKGFGCSSGLMQGEIVGLFYRYTSSGGFDYVADYLVGPRSKKGKPLAFNPQHGDSGTLFIIDDRKSEEDMKAIGILWGGQKSKNADAVQPYALLTNLGTVCQILDVELVCDWNSFYDQYFGAFAHVTLPSLGLEILRDPDLKSFMNENKELFCMSIYTTDAKQTKGLSKNDFVILSDVPDLVWKKRGGAYMRGKEGPNHFADMDQPNPKNNHTTLLKMCEDISQIDPAVWLKFYKDIEATEKGALPFRIAQIFDYMCKASKPEEFVCAAGILSHYVFDACMPLHISYMHHGDPQGPMKMVTQAGKEKPVPVSYNVHDEFDNGIVEYYASEITKNIMDHVKDKLHKNLPVALKDINNAKEAAVAAVKLMQHTIEYVSPKKVVKDFEELVDKPKRERCMDLWTKYGDDFLDAMAEAVVLTALLWEASWIKCRPQIRLNGSVSLAKVKALYETKKGFLDSVNLEEITNYMTW